MCMNPNDFSLEEQHVKVQVQDGVVTLSGNTTSYWAKDNLEDEVRMIKGVRNVKNELEVQPGTS